MFYKKNIFFRNFSRFLLSLFVVVFIFSILQNSALANDTFGLNLVGDEIVLGSDDPRPIAARVINIALSILGILAVAIVIYGGFVWMTSGGEEDKIDKAKKTLKAGIIGLVIILCAWGIAYFVLKQLGQATGVNMGVCVEGTTKPCGCNGMATCIDGSWGNCIGSTCLPGGEGSSCTSGINNVCIVDQTACNPGLVCNNSCVCVYPGQGNPCGEIIAEICIPNNNDCPNPNLFCDQASCSCIATTTDNYSELGDPCNDGGSCSAVNNVCNPNHGLTCDSDTCTCVGDPVITRISPVGGFCNNNINVPCLDNSSCLAGGVCDMTTPNAALGNLVTIFGYNFGSFDSSLSKIKFLKGQPSNFNCGDSINYMGHSYGTVSINNQCWMTENLRTTFYNDGASIENPASNSDWMSNTNGAYSWLNNDSNSGYGALYNWHAVNSGKLCPSGWDVPSDDQWYLLENYIEPGIPQYELGWRGTLVSPALKSSSNWPNNGNGNNNFNFSALPGGSRSIGGNFPSPVNAGLWWTKTESSVSGQAYNRSLSALNNNILRGSIDKRSGYSVRCILSNSSGSSVEGQSPSTVNSNCNNTWSNSQIITLLPTTAGFVSGDDIEMEVVTKDNKSDKSRDEVGPELDFLKINNIQRPGLCGLSDQEAKMNEEIYYYGLNLGNGKAYFGNSNNNVIGFSPNEFTNQYSGVTAIPNLQAGEMSTFVKKNVVLSNFLDFKKLADAPQGPSISSIFPTEGAPGQYVTIYGSGFNNIKGASNVYFRSQSSSDVPASFNFPPVCLQSVWDNNQIIVKVPDSLPNGNYNLVVNIFNWPNEIISSETFIASSSMPLKPGVCKINPTSGPHETPVSLWGEYFGEQALAIFNSNKQTNNTNTSDDAGAKKLFVSVPVDSITGPVKVSRAGVVGNEINFNVSYCLSNSDCSGSSGICCPTSSVTPGACVDNINSCYGEAPPSSFFEWSFSTGFETFIPTASSDVYSCASYSFCPTTAWVCPNSPGLCSPYPGGGTIEAGSCNNDCSDFSFCNSGGIECSYDSNSDRCVRNVINCDLPRVVEYNLGLGAGTTTAMAVCKEYENYWNKTFLEISVSTSCPVGWTMISPGKCINNPTIPNINTPTFCSVCPSGASCVAGSSGSPSEGICVSPRLCNDNYKCSSDVCQKPDTSSCQCCCDKNENTADGNPACCAPLTCANTCGAGNTGVRDFGLCSGCKISDDTATSTRDLACNCAGTSGKYCDVDSQYSNGACLDCTALNKTACIDHKSTCCWDNKSNLCRGGLGDESVWGNNSSNLGFCPYYDCSAGSITFCATSTPSINGAYQNISTCNTECSQNCNQFPDFSGCQSSNNCCWKTSTTTPSSYKDFGSCVAGNIFSNPLNENNLAGLCAYYGCNTPGSACQETPFGSYLNQNTCNDNCQDSSFGFGNSCTSVASTTVCNTGSCSLDCLQSDGSLSVPGTDNSCGTCCCNPYASVDKCSQINSKLSCVANKGLCSGSNRGLCCGCSSDSDCVNSPNIPESVGCGFDTCCKARPKIREDNNKVAKLDVSPEHNSTGVCRNAIIEINFDRRMDSSSFEDNILLLEETASPCSPGTYFVGQADFYHNNKKGFLKIVKNIINKSIEYIGKLTGKSVFASPSFDKNYCATLGVSTFEHVGENRTKVYFKPNVLLKAGTKYFVVVKGDEDLNSSKGVKSSDGVGMNGLGYYKIPGNSWVESIPGVGDIVFNAVSYKNSYIWHFITKTTNTAGQGICVIDYVTVSPSSYLFKTTSNDINENDLDSSHSTFDSVRDRDKVYVARAYSSDGQGLYPTLQYDWTWEWTISNSNIFEMVDYNSVVGWKSEKDMALIKAKSGVTEGKSDINAKIKLKPNSVTMEGNNVNKTVPAYLFVCNNPWPSFDEANNTWAPWSDNNNFSQYNYEFYYCRDAGLPETSDDLPAFLTDLAITKGQSLIKVCSNKPNQTCNIDNDCPVGGLCLVSFLKETYFFKEKVPRFIDSISTQNPGTGGTLNVSWTAPFDTLVDKFKVYYGFSNSVESQYRLVATSSCSIVGGNYNCSTSLTGLVNNQQYFVKVTAVSANLAETNPSQTVFATPNQQSVLNIPPTILEADVLDNKIVKLTLIAPTQYAVSKYKVYRGTSDGVYGTSFVTSDNSTEILIDLSSSVSEMHFFVVSAISDSDTESDKSQQASVNILYPSCKNVINNCIPKCFHQNKVYSLVEINGQCWFAENLQATQYNNGASIPKLVSRNDWLGATSGAYSCLNNDNNNCLQLGALYNGYALENNNICPIGWRVPSEDDWYSLELNLKDPSSSCPPDRNEVSVPYPCSPVGQKIKTSNWGGNNSSGFSAIQSGSRSGASTGSDFANISGAFFWSSKKINENRNRRMLTGNETGVRSNVSSQKSGHSVRCIKN